MPAVDICGITNTDDAKWAAIHGVEYVTVYRDENSPRNISVSRAREIRHLLPDYSEFALDFGAAENINIKELEKISPSIVKFYMPEGEDEIEKVGNLLGGKDYEIVVKFRKKPGSIPAASHWRRQVEIDEKMSREDIDSLKEEENEKIMIHGDLPLENIKKICGILKPHAWCLEEAISASSRRIDYPKMKKFIREITLI